MAPMFFGPWSWPPRTEVSKYYLTEQTGTYMCAMVLKWSRAAGNYIRHLDSCDISDNSERSDSSDSRQEQTCLQDFTTVCISTRRYIGFSGPWVCPPLFLLTIYIKLRVFGEKTSSGRQPARLSRTRCEVFIVQGVQCVLYKCAMCIVQGVQYVLYKVWSKL